MLGACSGVSGNGVRVTPVQIDREPSTSDTASSWLLRGRLSWAVRPFWMKADSRAGRDVGYTDVSEFWATTIAQYRTNNRRNGAPICQVQPVKDAAGMEYGSDGTLYVAAQIRSSGGVVTFKATGAVRSGTTCGIPGPVFKDPYVNNGQLDPAIDGTALYLANSTDGIAIPATVIIFDINSGPNAVGELSDPTAEEGFAVAVDSHHNLFWSNTNKWTGGGQVIEFHRGKMPGTVLKPTKIGTDLPGGVLLDKANDLLLIDQTTGDIYLYAPPYNAPPFATISLKGLAGSCAFGLSQKRIYCLDYQYGAVDVYAYPKGTYVYSYTNGIDTSEAPIGIAIRASP